MIALALPIGLLIGLSLGALGGGGSILAVPALVYLLGQTATDATTASLIIVGITALAGMAAHARAGRVRFGAGATFGVVGIAGSYLGARFAASVDPNVLLTAFAVLMVVAAGALLRRRPQSAESADGAPASHTRSRTGGGRASGDTRPP